MWNYLYVAKTRIADFKDLLEAVLEKVIMSIGTECRRTDQVDEEACKRTRGDDV